MRVSAAAGLAVALAGLASGCQPPETSAAVARAAVLPAAAGPSVPLPSPDTAAARWAERTGPARLVYGTPGERVLMVLECLAPATPAARLRIRREAPADAGAAALLALIGNGTIGRFPVDAVPTSGSAVWQGEASAFAPGWDAFAGEREVTATVPGAGLVRFNPSPLPRQLVEACRGPTLPAAPADRG